MNQNVICWFEIYVSNIARAKKFYSSVLGTKFRDMETPAEAPQSMKMAFFSDPGNMGVSGALVEMVGAKEGDGDCVNTMVYFPCDDCSVEESRVAGAGGHVSRTKFSIGEYGFIAICSDTEGNPFGLYSMK